MLDWLDFDIREIYKPAKEVAAKWLDCKLYMMVEGKLANTWGRMWEGQTWSGDAPTGGGQYRQWTLDRIGNSQLKTKKKNLRDKMKLQLCRIDKVSRKFDIIKKLLDVIYIDTLNINLFENSFFTAYSYRFAELFFRQIGKP